MEAPFRAVLRDADDSAENVAAARGAGSAGARYRGLDDARERLEPFLPAGAGPGSGQSGFEAR